MLPGRAHRIDPFNHPHHTPAMRSSRTRPSHPFATLRFLGLGLLGSFATLAAAATAAEPGWTSLFGGRSLDGWRASETKNAIKVADGTILCDGGRSHLFYTGSVQGAFFRNFEFEAEVRTQPGANSGIFFHTEYQETDWPAKGYEIQINNTATGEGGYRENKKTGSLYGIRNLHKQIVPDDAWFQVRVVVRGNHITVHVNDVLVVDYVEAGPALSGGTFALQCHDPGSRVQFRKLRVKPLPPGAGPPADAAPYRVSEGLATLHHENFPVIDLHTHLKGGLTHADVVQRYYRTGINAGIAVNCGLGFAITNDAGIDRELAGLRQPLTFAAMQAEGREWVNLFSLPAIARFDYVFTDAMTIVNAQGKRMRLWVRNEVEVGDPEAFMDLLVDRTVAILDREPVDIWVNPTYLPDVIAADYDRLWTAPRRQRVIAAAVRNGIAIEINDRFRLPSATFVREAKAAGARFTFGTNNGGREDLGALDHCVRVVQECKLRWQDLWMPGLEPSRAQRALAAGRTTILP